MPVVPGVTARLLSMAGEEVSSEARKEERKQRK